MRIISGYARGRKLTPPPPRENIIRPTSDRAREALFSIIDDRVKGAAVLDLFAGTGAMGIEALSRGARSVCFVEHHPLALDLISRNLQICMDAFDHQQEDPHHNRTSGFNPHEPGTVSVLKHDLQRGLPFFSGKKGLATTFDLIFLDPPYTLGLALRLLRTLDTSALLREHTLLIVEASAKETLPEHLSTLTLVDHRKYGEAGFWFYQPLSPETIA